APLASHLPPYAAPSPACGGGLGWGPHQIAALNGLASDTAPIPTFPRKRGKGPVHGEKIQTAPPPPLAGEGWGGSRISTPRSTISRRTLPPSQPSPASGGRGRFTARRFRPRPLPRLRGRAGVGAASDRRAQRSRVGHCPHPNLPPQAGEGAGESRHHRAMKTYLVGGAVRDRLLGLPPGDRDFVVVGETPDSMLAAGFRPVGRDFPVFLHPETGEEHALARTERKSAPGHRGFVVHADPSVTLEQDL